MRIGSGAVILALGLGVGCGGGSDTTTPPAADDAPVSVGAEAPGGADATAAARVTVAQHEATMKGIAQANGAMQKAVKSNALADAGTQAQELARLFGTVERFWQQHNIPEAVTLAQTGAAGATDVADAAAAGDQMKALMAAGNIGAACKQCHGQYREGDQEIGFTIKPGTITE